MYERFTDRARKVMRLANEEALRLNHGRIDTEHILLGLCAEGHGVAAHVLKDLGIDLATVRRENKAQAGTDVVAIAKLPQTPAAQWVMDQAMNEARQLGHKYVGTEHLLLGLLRQSEGIAANVLTSLGVTFDELRHTILELLGHATGAPNEGGIAEEHRAATLAVDDLPGDLRAAAVQLDLEILRLESEKSEAVAEQEFDIAAALSQRANLLRQTRQAMTAYWFRHYPVNAAWLTWNHAAVIALAQRIMMHRRWEELPTLGDYLEVAGCTDAGILAHCRQPPEHTDQCWVVDLLLAKATEAGV